MMIRCAAAFAALLLFAQAGQAMTLNKEVTLADGRGGQMIAITSGDLSAAAATRSTDASFSNFQPKADGGSVSGNLSREFSREGRGSESVVNGDLTLVPAANAASTAPIQLRIVDLSVSRDADGADFSGSVEINGTAVPAERLPKTIRTLLRRLVALTQM